MPWNERGSFFFLWAGGRGGRFQIVFGVKSGLSFVHCPLG